MRPPAKRIKRRQQEALLTGITGATSIHGIAIIIIIMYRSRRGIMTMGHLLVGSPERRFTGSLQIEALGSAGTTSFGIATTLFVETAGASEVTATATLGSPKCLSRSEHSIIFCNCRRRHLLKFRHRLPLYRHIASGVAERRHGLTRLGHRFFYRCNFIARGYWKIADALDLNCHKKAEKQ